MHGKKDKRQEAASQGPAWAGTPDAVPGMNAMPPGLGGGDPMGAQGTPGAGMYGPQGPFMYGAQGANMYGMPGAQAPGMAYGPMPPYPPHYYGHYAAQAWNGVPAGYAAPPPSAAQAGNPSGFAAALGSIADQNGLGMFKDMFNLDDGEFWKGALVGAAIVLLLTNENLRNSLIGGAAKTAEAVKSGLAGFAAGSTTDDGGEPGNDNHEEQAQ